MKTEAFLTRSRSLHAEVATPGRSAFVRAAVRGADSSVIGMRPLNCAGCLGRETGIRVTAPSKDAGHGPSKCLVSPE